MAKCKICGGEMLKVDGCTLDTIHINGKAYKRIKCGDKYDMIETKEGERCHDCNALYGHYHHLGCDSETCPVCHGQLLSCDDYCDDYKFI